VHPDLIDAVDGYSRIARKSDSTWSGDALNAGERGAIVSYSANR